MSDGGEKRQEFDPSMPNEARMLDYLMGGKDNFAADREAADAVRTVAPELPMMIREGRAFLGRAVRYLAEQGVRQFVDIGCGLPTRGSVHEVLEPIAPGSIVVYVDHDPVVIAHSRAIVSEHKTITCIQADARDPGTILTHPDLTAVIDLSRPTAIILHAIVTVISVDQEAAAVVDRVVEALAPGSFLLFSHAICDPAPEVTERLVRLFTDEKVLENTRKNVRTLAEVSRFLDGLDLVEPGLVPLPAWHPPSNGPDVDPGTFWAVGAIARKR
ncbi:SAM-dependent methyltransferase [Actinocorallia longicatena]|uniref:SAM-dependent methyltransferase n=1 Tax=Actinocorallia longicatena TaxID=111803 RepID=A0ABP6QJI5_9ACTN